MPGRSVAEAREAYLEPLRLDAACLSPAAHIQCHRGWSLGDEGIWELNGDGLQLTTAEGSSVLISASQRFKIVKSDPDKQQEGKFRVSTRMYSYSLDLDGAAVLRYDWHPVGPGGRPEPHFHSPPDMKAHKPCGRSMFEDFVKACIEMGVTPARDDHEEILLVNGSVHALHRTWTHRPPADIGEPQAEN